MGDDDTHIEPPLERIRAGLVDDGLHVLVVTDRTNIRYLSGFTGSAGTLVISPDRATLITDHRYALRAREECGLAGAPIDVQVATGSGWDALLTEIGHAGRVGLEADHVTWSSYQRFAADVSAELVPTTGRIEALRERKSTTEIARMRDAAAIADAALAAVRADLATGPTERRFAAVLDRAMLDLGADRPGFDTIVASGPNAARPHHEPGDRTITDGDLVIVDFGAELHGYRSDMTRSFSIGEPDDRSAEMLDAVRRAQAAGVACAGPGVEVTAVDAACRAVLDDAGLGTYFTHGTGHGVGLDIHEAPWVSARGTATLAPGHVITVEPGVYIAEFGGVRWEDTIVITDSGAEPLTRSDKDALIAI